MAVIVMCFMLTDSCSCKKLPTNGMIFMQCNYTIGGKPIVAGSYLPDTLGRYIRIDTLDFYVSNNAAFSERGNIYKTENILSFADANMPMNLPFSTPPYDIYDSFTFNIGVYANMNSLTESPDSLVNGPLKDPYMWRQGFGYYFMKIQGRDSLPGMTSQRFSYIVGSNTNYALVTLPARGKGNYTALAPIIVKMDSFSVMYVNMDVGKLLAVIPDLQTSDSTDNYTFRPGLGDTLASQIPKCFSYEQ